MREVIWQVILIWQVMWQVYEAGDGESIWAGDEADDGAGNKAGNETYDDAYYVAGNGAGDRARDRTGDGEGDGAGDCKYDGAGDKTSDSECDGAGDMAGDVTGCGTGNKACNMAGDVKGDKPSEGRVTSPSTSPVISGLVPAPIPCVLFLTESEGMFLSCMCPVKSLIFNLSKSKQNSNQHNHGKCCWYSVYYRSLPSFVSLHFFFYSLAAVLSQFVHHHM